jgi:SAM-dependent methyltransferase
MANLPRPMSSPRYNEWYGGDRYLRTHPSWFIHEAPWKAGQVMRMIERNGLEPRNVVDVGCGAGGVLAAMQPCLPEDCVLQGYDVSPAPIAMAKAGENDHLKYAVADVTLMTNLRADLMLVLDVIDHLEDPYTFLRAIKPMSQAKIMHLSLGLSVQKVLRRDGLLIRRQQGEVNFYTKELAIELLRDSGYEIRDFFYTGMSLDLNDSRGRLQGGIEQPRAINWRNFVMRGPRRALFRLNSDMAVRLLGGYHLMVLAE